MAGVGFIGAGAVLRPPGGTRMRGLTTAAIIQAAAAMGAACGLGAARLRPTGAGAQTKRAPEPGAL